MVQISSLKKKKKLIESGLICIVFFYIFSVLFKILSFIIIIYFFTQEALRLVGNEGPNRLLGSWAAGKQVIAVKWFWLTNQKACLPGWKNWDS